MVRARGSGASDTGEDDSPPWLEPAALSEDGESFLSRKWIVGGAAVFLVALVGTVIAVSSGEKEDPYGMSIVAGANGEPPLILAPKEPFRVKPDDPGGMKVDGEGLLIGQVASGGELDSEVKLATGPEQPVERPAPPPEPEPAPAPAQPAQAAGQQARQQGTGQQVAGAQAGAQGPTALTPPQAEAKPAPAEQAGAKADAGKPAAKAEEARPEVPKKPAYFLQLGAFSSVERANAGWQQFSATYEKELENLGPDIQPVKTGDKTMYRLRAGPISLKARADSLCNRLKKAGQACLVAEK